MISSEEPSSLIVPISFLSTLMSSGALPSIANILYLAFS